MFKEGIELPICKLMMRLAIGSNRKLVYIFMHIIGIGLKGTSKDGLNHFLLVVLPRILP